MMFHAIYCQSNRCTNSLIKVNLDVSEGISDYTEFIADVATYIELEVYSNVCDSISAKSQ